MHVKNIKEVEEVRMRNMDLEAQVSQLESVNKEIREECEKNKIDQQVFMAKESDFIKKIEFLTS